MSAGAAADNHDPTTDTVLCPKCRRTVRKTMCKPSRAHDGKPVCAGAMAKSCSVEWLAQIDRAATGRPQQPAK